MRSLERPAVVLVALSLSLAIMPGTCALCPFLEPLMAAEVESDPVLSQQCGLWMPPPMPPSPCPVPASPVVDTSRTRAQGVVLTATVPLHLGGNARAAHWRAVALDACPGDMYHTLWTHRSTQGFPPEGVAPNSTVTFGAPGLIAGKLHRFYVAFENMNGELTCWSQSSITMTAAFPSDGPALPTGQSYRVRDDFDRPPTSPRSAGGDGLGPDAVWWPSDYAYPGQTVKIASDGHSAYVVPTSGATYMREGESGAKSFAQAQVRVNRALQPQDPAFRYNLQVQARGGTPDPVTGQSSFYAAKLIYGPRLCTSPTILLFRMPEQYEQARCIDGQPDPAVGGVVCDGSPGREIPPLDQEEPGNPNISKPVWVRIEVETNLTEGDVTLVGSAHWFDGTWHSCTTPPWLDQGGLTNTRQWGMSFHDRHYYIETFGAGDSDPACP
ncbi:MAG: hypothetical protein KBD01_19675 [Acidobacteria bacterium]|nr:hypothetical protein [Acidobacteriota bacterium]